MGDQTKPQYNTEALGTDKIALVSRSLQQLHGDLHSNVTFMRNVSYEAAPSVDNVKQYDKWKRA